MKTKTYILSLCTLVFFASCQRDIPCKEKTTTYTISSSDKSKIPYTGKDTLTFVRTITGDTFTFYSTGWQSGFNTAYTADDCPQKQLFESRQLVFQSPTFSNTISLNQYVNPNTQGDYLDIFFQSTKFETRQLGNIYDTDSGSVILQGKLYNNIHFISNDNSAVNTKPRNYGCLYTWNEGIIKILFTTGETWELVPKK